MAAPVTTGAKFDAGTPIALFQATPRQPVPIYDLFVYDVSHDGQRFLINTEVKQAETTPMSIVLNWAGKIKQMTLAAGSKLGPYEIVAPLGAGGMGEVYRARDTRLERTVAIKILPAHVQLRSVSLQRSSADARPSRMESAQEES